MKEIKRGNKMTQKKEYDYDVNYDEDLVPNYHLPELLITEEGKVVSNSEDWMNVRRPQIISLFSNLVYGRIPFPESPIKTEFEIADVDTKFMNDKATRKEILIRFSNEKGNAGMTVLVFVPNNTLKPVPAFMMISFDDNNSGKLELNEKSPEKLNNGVPIGDILDRGYAFISVYHEDLVGHNEVQFEHGIHPLFFKEILPLATLGIISAAQISTFNIGTNFSLAGRSALLTNTHPFFVAVLTHFFIPNDRLNLKKIIGLMVAFFGVFLFFRDSFISKNSAYLLGDIILFVSAMIVAIRTVYVKTVVQKIDAIKLLAWEMSFALIPFYLMSLIFERHLPGNLTWSLVGALTYQGLIAGTFGFLTFTTLIKKHSASIISAFLFMTPIFGAFLSFLILKEEISFWFILAVAFVAIGIYIVNSANYQNTKKYKV